eukprot:3321444-Amphidinium_carterae.1
MRQEKIPKSGRANLARPQLPMHLAARPFNDLLAEPDYVQALTLSLKLSWSELRLFVDDASSTQVVETGVATQSCSYDSMCKLVRQSCFAGFLMLLTLMQLISFPWRTDVRGSGT